MEKIGKILRRVLQEPTGGTAIPEMVERDVEAWRRAFMGATPTTERPDAHAPKQTTHTPLSHPTPSDPNRQEA